MTAARRAFWNTLEAEDPPAPRDFRARQRSEVAALTLDAGFGTGSWYFYARNEPARRSPPYKSFEQAIRGALDAGYGAVVHGGVVVARAPKLDIP